MPSLTDGVIRQALKHVEKSRKQETLTDGEGRGTGRLVLFFKPMPTRVTADTWRTGGLYDGRFFRKHREADSFCDLSVAGRALSTISEVRDFYGIWPAAS
jgi:hypothetical protein